MSRQGGLFPTSRHQRSVSTWYQILRRSTARTWTQQGEPWTNYSASNSYRSSTAVSRRALEIFDDIWALNVFVILRSEGMPLYIGEDVELAVGGSRSTSDFDSDGFFLHYADIPKEGCWAEIFTKRRTPCFTKWGNVQQTASHLGGILEIQISNSSSLESTQQRLCWLILLINSADRVSW